MHFSPVCVIKDSSELNESEQVMLEKKLEEAEKILKKYYGYSNFRQGQDKIIKNILSGNDTFAIMPTGAGKSICFQIPAMLFDGLTLVISPLISLMKNQVDALSNLETIKK